MVYEYYYGKNFQSFRTTNIGDYIQSLEAFHYLPKNYKPILINRDKTQIYKGTKVKLIMAGWHPLINDNLFISSGINPIFISLYLNNTDKVPIFMLKI